MSSLLGLPMMLIAWLVFSSVGFSIEGDLAGIGSLLGKGGLEDSLPLLLGLPANEILELLIGLGVLLTVEYLQFWIVSMGTKVVCISEVSGRETIPESLLSFEREELLSIILGTKL